MALYTDKASLRKPTRGVGGVTNDFVSVDLDWDYNVQLLDDYLNFFVCTSGTIPQDPFQGMAILETDTQLAKLWTGTKWIVIGSHSVAKGYKALNTRTTDVSITTTPTFLLGASWTAEANRKYVVEAIYWAASGSVLNMFTNMHWVSGAIGSLSTGANKVGQTHVCTTGKYGASAAFSPIYRRVGVIDSTGWTSGTFSVGIAFHYSSGSGALYGTAGRASRILVRDAGAA